MKKVVILKKITGIFAKDKNEEKRYSGLYGDWYAVKYLTEEETVEEFLKIMEEYIDSYQYKISDEVLKYQFGFSPVVVNMTKDGRVELIDGFKRLLLVADDKLDYDVPVIVYNDLNDEDYLTLLFAANAWKTRTRHDGSFYDRGFLFSLVNRFGFDVTKALPYKFNIIDVLSDYCGQEDKYNYRGEEVVPKWLYKNPCLVKDIEDIIKILGEDFEQFNFILQEYSFGQYLFKVFIETVGQYRVIGKHFEDLDLSKIFNDYLDRHRKEIFKKINMSVPGYIENHFKPEANRDFNFKL